MNNRLSAKSTFRRILLVAASLGVGTVGWFMLGESETLIAAEPPNEKVLAKVGDESITEKNVSEAISSELMQLERQRHDLISSAVQNEVRNKLVEMEAKKRGTTSEALLEAEVTNKVPEITDTEVDAFYTERQAQIRVPKEQAAEQIRQYLRQQRQQEAYMAFVGKLEETYKVEYMMDPYRVEVAAEGPSKGGPDSAPVRIVEFSDFECPFCGRVNPTLKQIQDTYGDKVQIVFRQFPLGMHPNAPKAAEASLCANDQKKFWEMHDAMFADQRNLGVDKLKEKAAAIAGIDAAAFNECLDSGKYTAQVQADLEAGQKAGVSGTPAFFVNGRFISGAAAFETFAEIINDELKRKG